ncbi:MAG: hypothetical protein ACYSX1_11915 [Planctomycetota bacterium]|jgi:hypothetical protein
MNTSSLNVIKTVSWIIAAMAGILAASFDKRFKKDKSDKHGKQEDIGNPV